MKAGKELLGEHIETVTIAGTFPIVTDVVKSAVKMKALEIAALDENGDVKTVTKETINDIYGIVADDTEAGEQTTIYLTGQFKGDAVVVPKGTTASDFKLQLRKLGIFLVDTDNPVITREENQNAI